MSAPGTPKMQPGSKLMFLQRAGLGTLAAVRRTVDEKGREHLPPKHPTDTLGDTKWIYDYSRAVDAMDRSGRSPNIPKIRR